MVTFKALHIKSPDLSDTAYASKSLGSGVKSISTGFSFKMYSVTDRIIVVKLHTPTTLINLEATETSFELRYVAGTEKTVSLKPYDTKWHTVFILGLDNGTIIVIMDGEVVYSNNDFTPIPESDTVTLYIGDTSSSSYAGEFLLTAIQVIDEGNNTGLINEDFSDGTTGDLTPSASGNGSVTVDDITVNPINVGKVSPQNIVDIVETILPYYKSILKMKPFMTVLTAIAVGKEAGIDTSNLESEAQSLYDSLPKSNVSWLRNVPLHETVYGHLSAEWGTSQVLYLLKLLCRYYGFCLASDLPKASEMLQNWPIEEENYYGSGAPRWCGRVNLDGSGVTGVNANNQNIGFVNGILKSALIDGSINDTVNVSGFSGTVAEFVKNFIDAWKSKYPDLSSFQNDPYTKTTAQHTYYTATYFNATEIIWLLHRIGLIGDEVTDYIDWVENVWGSTVPTLEKSVEHVGNIRVFGLASYYYGAKSIIANLKKETTVEPNASYPIFLINPPLTVSPLMAIASHGIIIRRTPIVKKGDTFIIDNWLGRSIGLDGIELSNSTVAKVTKQNWKVVVSP